MQIGYLEDCYKNKNIKFNNVGNKPNFNALIKLVFNIPTSKRNLIGNWANSLNAIDDEYITNSHLYKNEDGTRLHARQRDIAAQPFEQLLTARVPHLLFRFSDGHQPHSMVGTFRKLMRDSGLLLNSEGQTRTLYSLRHTYATLALLDGGADIHTLSKQMGNSAAMIEQHYSKLTATMAADRLA